MLIESTAIKKNAKKVKFFVIAILTYHTYEEKTDDCSHDDTV